MDDSKQTLEEELALQKEEHQFQLQVQQLQHNHENNLKSKEIGWLGKFFGTSDNGARNIALTIMILLIIGATVLSCCIYCSNYPDKDFITNIWNWVIPIITLALGYIFGKNNQ